MSINRIRGAGGVIIDSEAFLELPKAPTKQTADVIRSGMIRYNKEWKAFEGVLDFDDNSVAYRRFANLDENGKLLTSQLPDTVTSGLQFLGTYSPISDDIDPPLAQVVLPSPGIDRNGDYYVVRGIMDAAQQHFTNSPAATGPVVFTPTNPEYPTNWIEIIYYIDASPIDSTKKIVTSAFARIMVANVPSTGHAGLISLATDEQLTAPFDTSASAQSQTALTDGDWVIVTEERNIRLRQNRTSISASSVLYDTTVMASNNRQFLTNAGTVQTTIDNLVLYGLRRTGDSMMDEGGKAKGRFGVVYGSAIEPAICFNNNPFDPVNNPGFDPDKWSDGTTGIFHPLAGSIGFSSAGAEKVRIAPTALNLYYTTTNPASNPTLRFESPSNTNTGISADSNIISFSSMNKVQVEFKNGISNFHGNIVVDGSSTFSGDVGVANLTATGNLSVGGNTILGNDASDTISVKGVSTFDGNTTFNANSNKFKNINLLSGGILTLESATNQSDIKLINSDLRLTMGGYADVSIYDNGIVRTRFNRYGIQLPVLTTIDNSVGVDGMIAYSNSERTSMQKVQGQWVPIGSGSVRTDPFAVNSWVLNGNFYTLTVTASNIVTAEIQEEISTGVFTRVEVDSVTFNGTSVVFSIPSTPDFRFAGRTLVTLR